MFEGDVSRLRD